MQVDQFESEVESLSVQTRKKKGDKDVSGGPRAQGDGGQGGGRGLERRGWGQGSGPERRGRGRGAGAQSAEGRGRARLVGGSQGPGSGGRWGRSVNGEGWGYREG